MSSTLTTFREAFPSVERLNIEVKEDGYMAAHKGVYKFAIDDTISQITCSNKQCRNGVCRVESVLRQMVSKGETEKKTFIPCNGTEGSPKLRVKRRECNNGFELNVSITYKKP